VPDLPNRAFEGAAIPAPPIPDDDGQTSPRLRRELDRHATGDGSASDVLDALSSARLLVPVVALLEESSSGVGGLRHEKNSAMATVLVDSPEHGRALLAFSGIEPLKAWRADARPVAIMAPLAARAAVGEDAEVLVVDVAGPTPFALAGTELLLMASLAVAPAGMVDPVLARAVSGVVESVHPAASTRFGVGAAAPAGPVEVWIEGVFDGAARGELLDRLSRDRVVASVARDGIHVTFRDTP
jgi:hypothetical protein